MNAIHPQLSGKVETPVSISTEAYVSQAWARDERDRLWSRVWQIACREEEIPEVGDFHTYEIQDRSIIVVRSAPDEIRAFHNSCPHRGRSITSGCGTARNFWCAYHGWQWNLAGRNTRVLDPQDWGNAIDDDAVALRPVKVGRWGGFVFVNPDADAGPLEDFLQTIPFWLDPFEIDRMRYKWRLRTRYAANWKVVTEAFVEGYHSEATHPQLITAGYGRTVSCPEGLHARMHTKGMEGAGIGTQFDSDGSEDIRTIPYKTIKGIMDTQWSNTTDTFVEAARRLPGLLPESTTPDEVGQTLMEEARRIDAARGVDWPHIDPAHMANVGINWHLFPNAVLLPNVTYLLGFRIRPDGFDPDSCIMEVFALERYPEGGEPQTQWEEPEDLSARYWPLLLRQDFKNMHAIQKGMKSAGPGGLLPNPVQEASIINFHRNLAAFMGRGAPRDIAGEGAGR